MKMLKRLFLAVGLAAFLAALPTVQCFAAAITPDSTYRGSLGGFHLIIARFTAGTADDGDTWASGLGSSVVAFWTSDDDNPTTQTNAGMAAAVSSGTFTFYPSEDNKPFTLFVLTR